MVMIAQFRWRAQGQMSQSGVETLANGLGNLKAHDFGNIKYLRFSRAVNYT
jgi:hypothetical protein